MKKLLMLAVIASAVASCTDADIADSAKVGRDDSAPVFHASFDDEDTRTHIDDKVRLLWNADDRISIFTTTYNQQYAFDGETGDNSGAFVKVSDGSFATGSEIERNYAVYPYAKGNKISYDNILTVTLPAVQTYAENSFGMGANTMVAVTENGDDYFLKFRNVGGFIKLKLYGNNITIANVSIRGHKSEPIAGKASVSAVYGYYPTASMSDSATDTVTLDCGDGVRIGSTAEECTEFWFVVPPTVFSEGFTIVVTDIEGKIFTKSTSKRIEVIRNGVLSMSAINVTIKNKPNIPDEQTPQNQILYTSTDGNIVEPNNVEAFGANIVSNTYENGKGVIAFDGNITEIGNHAFDYCCNLASIYIPNGITTINIAFFCCENLTNVYIPDSVSYINDFAFAGCSRLEEIDLCNIIGIGQTAFQNCIMLKSVKIKCNTSEISYVSHGAFIDCSSLEDIELLDVNYTSDSAFRCCTNLKTVTIGDNMKDIGLNTFYDCVNLSNIYCKPTTPPILGTDALYNISSSAKVYVPRESVEAYKSAAGWSDYASMIEGYDF